MSANKSAWNPKYKQGLYNLINKDKYIGDPNNIKYRSSWELAFCSYLDNNKSIIKWQCEIPITYVDLRNHTHRYYIDYYYQKKTNDENLMERVLVEIKPKAELFPPISPKNETAKALENYEYSIRTHIKNKLKWNSAEEYAAKHGMKFIILTEDHLKRAGLIPNK